jgi:hypothetical protein
MFQAMAGSFSKVSPLIIIGVIILRCCSLVCLEFEPKNPTNIQWFWRNIIAFYPIL